MPELHREEPTPQASVATLELTSSAFTDGAVIPKRYTADGENISPPLDWSAPPPHAESFAIVCEDPDAPSGIFFHWTAWNIPVSIRRLDEGVPGTQQKSDMRQGENGFCKTGYGGPKPPPGSPHRYVFCIMALDTKLDLPAGSTRRDFDAAIEGHVLVCGTLIGLYGRDEKKES